MLHSRASQAAAQATHKVMYLTECPDSRESSLLRRLERGREIGHVMLNSKEKRDSNYCRETIRGLLSKTSCPNKLMDQQSTAVSFPIPFSCTSVLSNHLTLAIQAGSVQLARFPAPMPFRWGYKQQLHCYCKK